MAQFPHARYLRGAHEPAQFGPDTGAEVAFAGRSNSGKSSAINAIVQRRALARTSKAPGQTQLINFFELEPERRLVDLPGYGFARVPRALQDHWRDLLERYFAERRSLKGLLLVVDSRRGLDDRDLELIDFATSGSRRVQVLLSKADKLPKAAAARALAQARATLKDRAGVQLFSALAHVGVEDARRALMQLLDSS